MISNGTLFVQTFVTVLVVMDPIGNVPVFLALTRKWSSSERRRAAAQASIVAAGVVFSFALFGQELLHLLDISLASLEVAGGLVLILAALELLRPSVEGIAAGTQANIAFVPLGTPLLAGPGAIAAVMVYIRQAAGVAQVLIVLGALGTSILVTFVSLYFAERLGRLLGENTIELITRIVGLLLGAIAVELVATGAFYWAQHGI